MRKTEIVDAMRVLSLIYQLKPTIPTDKREEISKKLLAGDKDYLCLVKEAVKDDNSLAMKKCLELLFQG